MFTYTPFGWLLLLGSIFALIVIVRSAIVPARQAASLRLVSHDQPPRNNLADRGDLLALLIFVVLMFGIVKWSWLGILPRLAALIGTPISLADRVAAAIAIGLLVGSAALAAYGIAEWVQSRRQSFPTAGS